MHCTTHSAKQTHLRASANMRTSANIHEYQATDATCARVCTQYGTKIKRYRIKSVQSQSA